MVETRRREYADEQDEEALWDEIRPLREPTSTRWFLPLLLTLLVLGTPWHATLGWTVAIEGGLPLWVWLSLACGFGISVLTAVAAVRAWRDPELEDRALEPAAGASAEPGEPGG